MENMFKQIYELQEKAKKIQDILSEKEVEVSTGGDMVVVRMNGLREIISLKIDETILTPANKEVVEELVLSAINEAHRRVQEIIAQEIGKLPGILGLPIPPGLFKLF